MVTYQRAETPESIRVKGVPRDQVLREATPEHETVRVGREGIQWQNFTGTQQANWKETAHDRLFLFWRPR